MQSLRKALLCCAQDSSIQHQLSLMLCSPSRTSPFSWQPWASTRAVAQWESFQQHRESEATHLTSVQGLLGIPAEQGLWHFTGCNELLLLHWRQKHQPAVAYYHLLLVLRPTKGCYSSHSGYHGTFCGLSRQWGKHLASSPEADREDCE